MIQSDTINIYARRVKTPKVLRWFLGINQSWGCNYFSDQATPPQQERMIERVAYALGLPEIDNIIILCLVYSKL